MMTPESKALTRLCIAATATLFFWRILSGIEHGARLEAENSALRSQIAEVESDLQAERSDLDECRDKIGDAMEVLAR